MITVTPLTHSQALFALSPILLFAAFVYFSLFVAPPRRQRRRQP